MAESLTGFVAVTAGKSVILSVYFENVDGFLEADFGDGVHEGFDFVGVVGPGEGTANLVEGDVFESHGCCSICRG
jgi:hypothetical protein